MIDFAGRLVLVTGASSGLGAAIARQLAFHEGADVILAARRTDRLDSIAGEIQSRCVSRAYVVTVDLSHPDGPSHLAEQIREIEAGRRLAADTSDASGTPGSNGAPARPNYPRLYGLVNNAGVTLYGEYCQAEAPDISRVLQVNLNAPVLLTRLLLPGMLDRGEGAILNITSLGACVPIPYQSVYSASKHGLQAFSDSLAAEFRGSGIVVSSFAPAGIDTEMITISGQDARFGSRSAFYGTPERIGAAAVRSWKRCRVRRVGGPGAHTIALLGRIMPRALVRRAAERIYRPPQE